MNSSRLVQILLEDEYKFSSTQLDLPADLANQVQTWGKLNISDSELYIEDGEMGREDNIHVTLVYGLTGSNPSKRLEKIISSTRPFVVELGKISLFDNADKPYDVVKLDIISPELEKLHHQIVAQVPNKQTWPEYKPHCTVAYVKKGAADSLVGNKVFGVHGPAGQFWAYEVVFWPAGDDEDAEREKFTLPLMREMPEIAPKDKDYEVDWDGGRRASLFRSLSRARKFSHLPGKGAQTPQLVDVKERLDKGRGRFL